MASRPAAFAGWFVRMSEFSFPLVCARLFVNRHLAVWLVLGVWLGGVAPGDAPSYRIFVSSESGDIVSQLTWDGVALKTVKVVPVGIMPADIDGPHNVTVSPDGELAFVANSDFHGDHPRMNVVSIVYTPQMVTLTNLPACDMPHGVKVNHAGTKVYVTCMNSDEVLEIDRASLAIARRHKTGEGMLPQAMPMKMGHGGAQGGSRRTALHDACMPTFVSVSPDDTRLYVACNHSDELMVLDAGTLDLVKAIRAGHGAYNVEPSPDGKWVIVTNKKDQSVSLIDAATLAEVARIPTTKPF